MRITRRRVVAVVVALAIGLCCGGLIVLYIAKMRQKEVAVAAHVEYGQAWHQRLLEVREALQEFRAVHGFYPRDLDEFLTHDAGYARLLHAIPLQAVPITICFERLNMLQTAAVLAEPGFVLPGDSRVRYVDENRPLCLYNDLRIVSCCDIHPDTASSECKAVEE